MNSASGQTLNQNRPRRPITVPEVYSYDWLITHRRVSPLEIKMVVYLLMATNFAWLPAPNSSNTRLPVLMNMSFQRNASPSITTPYCPLGCTTRTLHRSTPPEGIVHTAVETFAEDELEPYKITGYRSVISHSRGNNDIQASGPINQKGLKIFYYQGKYLVIVRRRDESMTGPDSIIDSSSYLGWVDNLSQITPDFVNETFANPDNRIPGFFKIGQWGNVADSMLLVS